MVPPLATVAATTPAGIRGTVLLRPAVQTGGDPQPVVDAQITVTSGAGVVTAATSADDGSFALEGLSAGPYHVELALPDGWREVSSGLARDILLESGQTAQTDFRIASAAEVGADGQDAAAPDGSALVEDPAAAEADADQMIALASVSALPIRFAEGRDVLAQVQRRVLGDGLVWLGVPFRTQIDGGAYQYVNCGPASLTMVLAAFGLDVGPSQVRDYLNSLIDNYDQDTGTSLDVLTQIGRQAGLSALDLYSDRGGYRYWSTDAVRWHVQQGQPVITLVKYRSLPGHGQSPADSDHYIVISGLTPNGFIYNDAAFATTLGYGLEITDAELEVAWSNSTIPHHAVAMALATESAALSFPELARPGQSAAPRDAPSRTARLARQLAEDDQVQRPAPALTLTLTLTPGPSPTPAPTPAVATPAPVATPAAAEEQTAVEPGVPMGLLLEATDQPAEPEPDSGPGRMAPLLVALLGSLAVAWSAWSMTGVALRRRAVSRRAVSGQS